MYFNFSGYMACYKKIFIENCCCKEQIRVTGEHTTHLDKTLELRPDKFSQRSFSFTKPSEKHPTQRFFCTGDFW